MDCKACGERFRADKLIEDYAAEHDMTLDGSVDGWTSDEMMGFINKFAVPCPSCGKFHWTDYGEQRVHRLSQTRDRAGHLR